MSFATNSSRLPLSIIPKERYSIKVFHLNDARDPDGIYRRSYVGKKASRRPVTIAQVVDRETMEPVVWAASVCGKRDEFRRRTGSGIALGRLVKAYQAYLNDQCDAISAHPVPNLRVVR